LIGTAKRQLFPLYVLIPLSTVAVLAGCDSGSDTTVAPGITRIEISALIMASATLYFPVYSTARRGGLRRAGGISMDARMAAHMERGFCPKNRSTAVGPSARLRLTITGIDEAGSASRPMCSIVNSPGNWLDAYARPA